MTDADTHGDAAAAFDVTDSRVSHDGMLLRVRVDTVAMPDGARAEREVVERPDAVAVVPVDADGLVVLVRQYRHAVGGYQLEIPAGLRDVDGEDERATAARELTEETGLAAGTLRPLARIHNSAGWTAETTGIYVATDLSPAEPDGDFEAEHEEADMDVVRLPLSRAVDMVVGGHIRDAKTVVGLLMVSRNAGDPH